MAHKSKYATKVKSGKQTYGPGCCGHKKPDNHMQSAVNELREERRKDAIKIARSKAKYRKDKILFGSLD